jgi:hypothetical protein
MDIFKLLVKKMPQLPLGSDMFASSDGGATFAPHFKAQVARTNHNCSKLGGPHNCPDWKGIFFFISAGYQLI